MKPVRVFLLLTVLIFAVTALGQGTKSTAAGAPQAQEPTIGVSMDGCYELRRTTTDS